MVISSLGSLSREYFNFSSISRVFGSVCRWNCYINFVFIFSTLPFEYWLCRIKFVRCVKSGCYLTWCWVCVQFRYEPSNQSMMYEIDFSMQTYWNKWTGRSISNETDEMRYFLWANSRCCVRYGLIHSVACCLCVWCRFRRLLAHDKCKTKREKNANKYW